MASDVAVKYLHRMRVDRAGGLLLLAIVTLLTPPLAVAMPPDQSWIAGIYDAADLDDLVTLVADLCARSVGHSYDLSPPLCSSEELASLTHGWHERFSSSSSARGPPENRSQDVFLVLRRAARPTTTAKPTSRSLFYRRTRIGELSKHPLGLSFVWTNGPS